MAQKDDSTVAVVSSQNQSAYQADGPFFLNHNEVTGASLVSRKIVNQILHASDVSWARRILHTRYAGSNVARKAALKKDIANTQQGDEEDKSTYFERLSNLWEELDAIIGKRRCGSDNCLCRKGNDQERHVKFQYAAHCKTQFIVFLRLQVNLVSFSCAIFHEGETELQPDQSHKSGAESTNFQGKADCSTTRGNTSF
ncbi:hypothetical protein QQ045_021857 [Rhodiola kirilowii]